VRHKPPFDGYLFEIDRQFNLANKTSYKFKGLLVTHLKARRSCPSFKKKPLQKHFGKRNDRTNRERERWGNTPPWMVVLVMGGRRN
jgi:hypothetical protein